MFTALFYFLVGFLIFFYAVPFVLGYLVTRIHENWGRRWAPFLVSLLYAAWMFTTWYQEGYTPVSVGRLVSLEPAVVRMELLAVGSHLLLILTVFLSIYWGSGHGARVGYLRNRQRNEELV